MQDSIKSLVANKTITQLQEYKIVTALTSTNSQRSKSGQTKGANTNKQLAELTKLVSDRVIKHTQAHRYSVIYVKIHSPRGIGIILKDLIFPLSKEFFILYISRINFFYIEVNV